MIYSHSIVIGTRKSFQMTNLYKLSFCQRKYTAAAAYNLPAHMCYKGLCSIGNIWEILPDHNSYVEGPIEALPAAFERPMLTCNL